jgi:hypothetical protein
MDYSARKHGYGADYAKRTVNEMTPYELLEAISEALEEMKNDSAANPN